MKLKALHHFFFLKRNNSFITKSSFKVMFNGRSLIWQTFFCLGLFKVPHRWQSSSLLSQILFHIWGRTSQYTWYSLVHSHSDSKLTQCNLVQHDELYRDKELTTGTSVTWQNIFLNLQKFSGLWKDSWTVNYIQFSWELLVDLWIKPGFEIVFSIWKTFPKWFV